MLTGFMFFLCALGIAVGVGVVIVAAYWLGKWLKRQIDEFPLG